MLCAPGRLVLCGLAGNLLLGCSTDNPGSKTAELAPISLRPGEEILSICRSRSLNNEQPLYIQSVRMTATPGLHHSAWFVIKDDGTLGDDCGGQPVDIVSLALKGRALFLQSTQSTDEAQAFPPGAGIVVPPHSAIAVDLHLINSQDSAAEAKATLELNTVSEQDLRTRLNAFAFMYTALNVPPRVDSEFTGSCDLAAAQGSELESSVYYASSHYHYLGTGATIQVMGGGDDGAMVFDGHGRVGEPWGKVIEPAMPLRGATGLRFACSYRNTRDTAVAWGSHAVDEMCAVLGYIDGDYDLLAVVDQDEPVASADTVVRRRGDCKVLAFSRREW